ncbi:hypothetical protein QAD02_001473 [Eretmocerus hayati]|uniref:Uncharacterized protein n=1 Tax=Eretmocerus hayati TaxID=131215 RepID=A0ACC2NGI2_9HYME|nr:hypothetical protein QAD02_001473 [Eretmocerus hayati]
MISTNDDDDALSLKTHSLRYCRKLALPYWQPVDEWDEEFRALHAEHVERFRRLETSWCAETGTLTERVLYDGADKPNESLLSTNNVRLMYERKSVLQNLLAINDDMINLAKDCAEKNWDVVNYLPKNLPPKRLKLDWLKDNQDKLKKCKLSQEIRNFYDSLLSKASSTSSCREEREDLWKSRKRTNEEKLLQADSELSEPIVDSSSDSE